MVLESQRIRTMSRFQQPHGIHDQGIREISPEATEVNSVVTALRNCASNVTGSIWQSSAGPFNWNSEQRDRSRTCSRPRQFRLHLNTASAVVVGVGKLFRIQRSGFQNSTTDVFSRSSPVTDKNTKSTWFVKPCWRERKSIRLARGLRMNRAIPPLHTFGDSVMQSIRVEWNFNGSRDREPCCFYATLNAGVWHFRRQDAMEFRAYHEPSIPKLVQRAEQELRKRNPASTAEVCHPISTANVSTLARSGNPSYPGLFMGL